MKLSVITINYNNFEGLRKTVESVVCQTYHDFEYIIVDGASTDGSAEYIRELGQKNYPFALYWVSEKDNGIYNAMNKGAQIARGEYLLYMNSGDCIVNNMVLFEVFSKKSYDSDLLLGKCYVSKDGERIWLSTPSAKITLATLYNQGIMHQATFIKRSCLLSYNGYDESFRWLADIDFWFRSLIYGNATEEALGVIVAEFDNSGVSSCPKDQQKFQREVDRIFKNEKLHRIYPDYERMAKVNSIVQEYGWISSHRVIRYILRKYHKLITHFGTK